MSHLSIPSLSHVSFRCALSAICLTILSMAASAEPTRVTFPENLERLVHYTTVKRGNVTENILTTRAAIEAVRKGQPIPHGTHFVLADFREGKPYRYFVMQKGEGWGKDYDERRRTSDWHFQWFWPDKSINAQENTQRCQSCHQSQEDSDYLYTHTSLRDYKH